MTTKQDCNWGKRNGVVRQRREESEESEESGHMANRKCVDDDDGVPEAALEDTNPRVLTELEQRWALEQREIKTQLVIGDQHEWSLDSVSLIGGVDISFIKGNDTDACVSLVVLNYPALEVVYEDCHMVRLEQPYIPGFLAFREVEHLQECVEKLRRTKPALMPQVIMVDGNGILHPRGLGLASHFGVLVDVPTIGVGKKLFMVDGLDKKVVQERSHAELKGAKEWLPLVGSSHQTWGAALRSTATNINPIYVSVGHRISLETAVDLVARCCHFRVPEPVRQADQRSRTFLRTLQQQQQHQQQLP